MKIVFRNYIVNNERDFIEDGISKIETHLTIFSGAEEDINKILPSLCDDIYVINLNTQTGEEMDKQRLEESIQFINNRYNNL